MNAPVRKHTKLGRQYGLKYRPSRHIGEQRAVQEFLKRFGSKPKT